RGPPRGRRTPGRVLPHPADTRRLPRRRRPRPRRRVRARTGRVPHDRIRTLPTLRRYGRRVAHVVRVRRVAHRPAMVAHRGLRARQHRPPGPRTERGAPHRGADPAVHRGSPPPVDVLMRLAVLPCARLDRWSGARESLPANVPVRALLSCTLDATRTWPPTSGVAVTLCLHRGRYVRWIPLPGLLPRVSPGALAWHARGSTAGDLRPGGQPERSAGSLPLGLRSRTTRHPAAQRTAWCGGLETLVEWGLARPGAQGRAWIESIPGSGTSPGRRRGRARPRPPPRFRR